MRYAVLLHELPENSSRSRHYDLLLENEGVLLCWELASPPLQGMGQQPARRLPDHRLAYLDYEGPISNHRGQVTRISGGQLEWTIAPPADVRPLEARLDSNDGMTWLLRLIGPDVNQPDWVVVWQPVG